jgi:arabinose-5-phosphate isomerase
MLKKIAKQVLKIEADSIRQLISRIDKDFEKAVELIYACKGRVVVTAWARQALSGRRFPLRFLPQALPASGFIQQRLYTATLAG